jgi:hypothetical protein
MAEIRRGWVTIIDAFDPLFERISESKMNCGTMGTMMGENCD